MGLPYEDNDSVPGRQYAVCSTCLGIRSGVRVDGLWRLEMPYKRRSARGTGRSYFSTSLPE
ncbi:hypothetical protein DPMN_022351 [Dreissena polymorpha]|uniref:Uncharacterized protein n=1 Tax=Dreissena polymorpha TaxID=45954 RepID=A0A9D4NK71_DREPO|nr:hypothetical protein DPMN_022351 [Dreissena polymorpha]